MSAAPAVYSTISKVMTIVVINKTESPIIKTKSAIFSYFSASLSFLLRIDRNDKKLLVIKDTVATAVNSSIIDVCFNFKTFKEVKTIKQRPRRFDDVFNM